MGYNFSGLTVAQKTMLTFGGWHVGSKFLPQPQARTVKKLIDRGLLIERRVQQRFAVGFNLTLSEYDVPIAVHMAWCERCATTAPRTRRGE